MLDDLGVRFALGEQFRRRGPLRHLFDLLVGAEIAEKRGLPLAVLTYSHAPGVAYRQYPGGFKYLSTTDRKLDLLKQLGVDIVYLISFTSSFASLAPQDFVDQYLVAFHSQVVVAGYDHTYGPANVASMELLPGYAKGRFDVVTVPKFTADDSAAKVGSVLAEKAKAAKIEEVVFDRGGYTYHGRVKALADAAREGGLRF